MSKGRPSAEREPRGSGLEAVFGRGANAFRRRFGVVAVAAIVLLVVLGAVLAWRQYDDSKQKALNDMHARVVLAATVFDTYFAGQLGTLSAIADSPSVVRTDTDQMATYFAALQSSSKQELFTGGLGWIDRSGTSRVSGSNPRGTRLRVTDRSFFKAVITTGKPFISEGLTSRVGGLRVVVMAVPTRDAAGRITGVLAGALELRPSRVDQRTTDLGFEGLVVIDRAGQQVTLRSFARPENRALVARLKQGDGVLDDTRGLNGSEGRAVAYATSKAPGWITVIDRPRASVFAPARRSLEVEMASILAAAFIVLAIVGWALIRSRRDMEAEREQVRNWDELAQSLGEASAAAEVSTALGAALVSAFPQARVIVAVEDDDGALRMWTFGRAEAPPLDRRGHLAMELARLAIDASAPVRLRDAEQMRALLGGSDVEASDSTDTGTQSGSLYALPLLTDSGRAIGSATLLLPQDQPLDDSDEALVVAHAEHAARALTRARRHEREHDVAVTLQRSLLPDALPTVDGLELCGRYNAGGVGLEVGGDWYDAVRRPDGLLHLTVGDVAGRGIQAAVLMGQLRNAFRALAYEHVSPAEIARRLTNHVPDGGMATAVFLALDPYTGDLRYTSAGHLPPILMDVLSGSVTALDKAGSPPLGWADPKTIDEAHLALPSQMTLLAFTDGLVERRGVGIDEGMTRLADLLRERPELGADDAADVLLEKMVDPLAATDDIALLLIRLSEVPAAMRIEIPSDPAVMRGLRARLRAWLSRRGLDDDQQNDAILAVSEACNNAIEHAYRHNEGTIRLTLEHRGSSLLMVVEDDGTWVPPVADPTRGRGRMIMEGTMHTARIEPGATGTRVDLELRLVRGRDD